MEIRLQSRGYQLHCIDLSGKIMGVAYSDPPDIFIFDLSQSDGDGFHAITSLKKDSYFSAIPVIAILDETTVHALDWLETPLDDFLLRPVSYPEFFTRIELSIHRIRRVFDNNPLTRLPGNTSIQQAIEKAIGLPMAVCYVDINNFKPYNDVYGFSHGDEVLRMLARIMFNTVKESGGGFTGHIGGDDFVFIVPKEHAEAVSAEIIANFTTIVADLFGEQEKSCGFYVGLNRRGQEEQIPLLGVSIAIVHTDSPLICHYGKIAEVAAELKSQAKKSGGSCYLVDKRRS
jgi:GGDEF domain-containing protein